MRVIAWGTLRDFATGEPAPAMARFSTFNKTLEAATWQTLADVKQTFGKHVDAVHGVLIFDVGARKYRVVARVFYTDLARQRAGRVYILWVGDHDAYDKLTANDGKLLKQLAGR